MTELADARAAQADVCRYRPMLIAGTPACSDTLTDGTGEIDLLFLGRIEIAGFRRGRRCTAAGMTAVRDDRSVLWNARHWFHEAGTFGSSPGAAPSQRDPEVRLPDTTGLGKFRMVSTEFDIDRIRR